MNYHDKRNVFPGPVINHYSCAKRTKIVSTGFIQSRNMLPMCNNATYFTLIFLYLLSL